MNDPPSAHAANWRLAHWQINIGYALFFAGIAAFTPYAAIYYRGLGFSGFQVGLLTAMPAIGLMLTSAFWGTIADAFAAHRTLLRAALGTSAVFALVASQFDTFPMLLVWITLLSFSTVPLRSLMDHYAVTVGEKVGQSFGRIRLWGAFGYSAFVLTLGRIMSREVTSAFLIGYGIALAGTFIATFGLPKLERRTPERLIDGIGDVLKSASFRMLLFIAFTQSVAAFSIVTALGVHIVSHGGTNPQVGAAFAAAALSELPVFMAGAWLVKRFGHVRMIIAVGILYTIRMLALSVTTAAIGVIALQCMHGITFGAFLVTAVPFARTVAGRNYPATAQAVLTMVAFGFGVIAGSMMAGWAMDHAPTTTIFRWVGIGMAISTVIYAVGQTMIARREKVAALA